MISEKIGGGVTLINYPNKWTANTEIDLGNGLYGKRCTGTITIAANTRAEVYLTGVSQTTGRIFACGGSWDRGDGNINFNVVGSMLTATGVTNLRASMILQNLYSILFYSTSDMARTDASYDIWVIYTKS